MPSKTPLAARAGWLRVDVRDLTDRPVADASVTVKQLTAPSTIRRKKPSSGGRSRGHTNGSAPASKEIKLKFDKSTGTFFGIGLAPGKHSVAVARAGMDPQSRETVVQPAGTDELFVLGKKGLPAYSRGNVKMPFEVDPDLISVKLGPGTSEDDQKQIFDRLARSMKLRPEETPETARRLRMQIFRLPGKTAKIRREILEKLREHPRVEFAGSIVGMREESYTQMTDEAVCCFKAHVTEPEVHKIAKEFGFEVIRHMPYSPNTFHFRAQEPGSLELLKAIERLADTETVEWAEPNLLSTPELDTINPADVLWQGCWDRRLIGCGDAWQRLQDAGLPTYGSPDVIIGVVDTGTQSSGGAPTNPDFQGTVSNGATKVYRAYDFANMVANNDAPWGDHGSGVAGVTAANAANAAPIAGQFAGVVGAAPNCRLLTMAQSGTDTQIADMYIWAAGFNPNSPTVGFPAPISPGADVFTCSLGLGAGAALSGTAKAMIDHLTSFGRGGKGCMLFFSTGNGGVDNTINRPYSAYEKSFGIAGTTLADDGVTEIHAPFSGTGKIALSAPTHDQFPTLHNPPVNFATWACSHLGTGNMISHRAIETTLTAASAAGANTLSLASVAGLAINQVIHVGAIGVNGSEPAQITAVNAMTNTINVQGMMAGGTWSGGLLNAHVAGSPVAQGPANNRNNFGGTSSATPLTAGVAALVLSAEPDLTWIEARQVLRDSAIRFDLANTDPVGRWLDAAGNPSTTSGQPAVRSNWYGHGRVNADGAVQRALTFGFTSDIVVRDNLADTGAVPAVGAFWNSPDVWVRNLSPASEGAAALPANYATAGPHVSPIAGQANWVYARLRNIGTGPSLDCYVRLSITHWPGTEFTYPTSFIPTNRPGNPVPSPMTTGTYLIGEVKVTGIPAGAEQIVNVQWPAALIPPETVTMGTSPPATVRWHPCLLVECSPLDGPTTGGNHVWDSNSLCQKNISIVYSDAKADFATAMVLGNEDNLAEYVILEIDRGYLPREVTLYVDLINPALKRRLRHGIKSEQERAFEPAGEFTPEQPSGIKLAGGFRVAIEAEPAIVPNGGGLALRAPTTTRLEPMAPARLTHRAGQLKPFTIGHHNGSEVVFCTSRGKTQIPVYGGAGTLNPVVIGGITGKGAKPGEYSVVVLQRDPRGQVTGSAEIAVQIGK
ncbi:MAG: S8 family serine peptidase [Actinobacteria bacterium]|nr:S8 family serine peptidase [Actinomycetota bacterium]